MKAICGAVHFDGPPIDVHDVERMHAALLGRGAQRSSGWCDARAAFAGSTWTPSADAARDETVHVDPESGCVGVADALLFERLALGEKLGLPRARVDQASDVELVVHAYLRWGCSTAEHLDGDFAFLVWDPARARAYYARDGFGVRPLYVHRAPGRVFAFASNASAVVASERVPWTLDEGRIADSLVWQLESVDHTSTLFASVKRVPPGHHGVVEASGERIWRYYAPGNLPGVTLPSSDDAAADAVFEALDRAVRRHLERDTNVGSMLSGGLDSSAVAAIAADVERVRARRPLCTFSAIDSANPSCAETRAIRTMLRRDGFAPTLVDLGDRDAMPPSIDGRAWPMEEPFDSLMLMVDAQYAAAARAGVGALLDGIDADGVFSEQRYWERLVLSGRLGLAFVEAREMGRFYGVKTSTLLLEYARTSFVPDPLRRAYRAAKRRSGIVTGRTPSLVSADFARRAHVDERLDGCDAPWLDAGFGDVVEESRRSMSHPNVVVALERYRRVASHHGIEPRHPFLDRALVELAIRLPERLRLRHGYPKFALRRAVQRTLPGAVAWRRGKEHLGWSYTMRWLTCNADAVVGRLEASRRTLSPYVDDAALTRALTTFQATRSDDSAGLLLDALSLASWLDRFGRRNPRELTPEPTSARVVFRVASRQAATQGKSHE